MSTRSYIAIKKKDGKWFVSGHTIKGQKELTQRLINLRP